LLTKEYFTQRRKGYAKPLSKISFLLCVFVQLCDLCVKPLFREILLTRNFGGTQAYDAAPEQQLESNYRGIMFATTVKRDERGYRTVEKQTARVFVVLI
jgi:hypothetical protein